MGFFGSLIGWDQSMGAMNAVLGSYLIEKSDRAERKKIAQEIINILSSVRRRQSPEVLLEELSRESRVVQMNFIALACDNLGINPPVPNNVWTRVKNPYQIGQSVDADRISLAIEAIEKQDGIRVTWPGNASIDFTKMHRDGALQ